MGEQRGYTPEEIERGEDQAWHMPFWGCALVLAALAVAAYVILLR